MSFYERLLDYRHMPSVLLSVAGVVHIILAFIASDSDFIAYSLLALVFFVAAIVTATLTTR